MIFFSDLDRTLIYSKKFIIDKDKLYCVEILDGEEISYISKDTVNLLKRLMKNKRFIAATTRSIEQYTRIKLEDVGLHFDYAITTNGGNILYKGEPLRKWQEIISERLKSCNSLEDTKRIFDDKYSDIEGILKIRSVDDMFFYIVVDFDKFAIESIKPFEMLLKKLKWKMYVSGRKIYFLPEVLTKENAIEFLIEYLKEDSFCAMGDSNMDLGMLEKSKRAFVPAKSPVIKDISNELYVSRDEGFNGTEQIIKELLNI